MTNLFQDNLLTEKNDKSTGTHNSCQWHYFYLPIVIPNYKDDYNNKIVTKYFDILDLFELYNQGYYSFITSLIVMLKKSNFLWTSR